MGSPLRNLSMMMKCMKSRLLLGVRVGEDLDRHTGESTRQLAMLSVGAGRRGELVPRDHGDRTGFRRVDVDTNDVYRSQGELDPSPDRGRPRQNVDRLATQLLADPPDSASARTDAHADRVEGGVVALDGDLHPDPGDTGDGTNLDRSDGDLGHFGGDQPSDAAI